MTEADALRAFCLEATRASGLTVVGDCFYQFEAAGVTGAVLLAESHLAVHTWPEKQLITVDLYVCNVCRNNDSKALWLFDRILEAFQAERVTSRSIDRNLGEAPIA